MDWNKRMETRAISQQVHLRKKLVYNNRLFTVILWNKRKMALPYYFCIPDYISQTSWCFHSFLPRRHASVVTQYFKFRAWQPKRTFAWKPNVYSFNLSLIDYLIFEFSIEDFLSEFHSFQSSWAVAIPSKPKINLRTKIQYVCLVISVKKNVILAQT